MSDGQEIESPYWLVDPGESPEMQAERADLDHFIQRCLNRLPLDQRLALVLVDLQQLSYPEAAASMGVSLGTLKSRLSRGRERMRRIMLQAGGSFLPQQLAQT
jgi:RNA polymerase sigma-70 factor (ECF subfamily)